MPNIFDPTIPNNPPQGIQAQLDLLYLYNPDVANKLIEQLRAGLIEITDLVAEVQKALADLQGVLRYKGSVETYADLPTEGNVTGDVWNVIDTDKNYAWDGEKWDEFGSGIDTSVFLTKTDASATYIKKTAVSSDIITDPNPSTSQVPSLNLIRKYLVGPTWFDAEITVKPTDKIAVVGFNRQVDMNATNGVSGILFLTAIDSTLVSSYGNYGMAIRITHNGGIKNNNWHAEVLYNTTGEEVNIGTASSSGALTLYPVSGSWQKAKYRVGLLYSSNQNGYVYNFYLSASPFTIDKEIPYVKSPIPSQEGNAGKVLSTNGTTPEWVEIDSGLPDQTGHTGFLRTNGTDATWSDTTPLINNLPGGSNIIVGPNSTGERTQSSQVALGKQAKTVSANSIAIGLQAYNNGYDGSICIGSNSSITGQIYSESNAPIAIGTYAKVENVQAIQIGTGTNQASKTVQFYNYRILNSNGTIPSERLATAGTTGQVLSKTDDGMAWTDMTGGTSEIVHDDTLSGSGTAESPLKVADNTYLPLSGGALTGPLVSSKNVPSFEKTPVLSLCAKTEDGTNGDIATISMTPNVNTLFLDSMLSLNTIISTNVGSAAQKVRLAYIAKINNGADIAVPTEGGTLARVEDINAAVGDIASVLDAINGESV